MAACVSMALQRWIRALAKEWRRRAGAWRALVWAKSLRKVVASSLQCPPTSIPKTTSRHRRSRRRSGQVRSLFLLASLRAAALYCPPRMRGCPARVRGETKAHMLSPYFTTADSAAIHWIQLSAATHQFRFFFRSPKYVHENEASA